MDIPFVARKVAENIYWVGAIDWQLSDFHGYRTERGTTYNAFLITGKKNVLIDTVKRPYFKEMLSRVTSVIPPEKIDIIVSNHAEPDHSGSLVEMARVCQPEKIYASQMGCKALQELYHGQLEVEPVADGAELELGGKHLLCVETRMIHWPDSMFSYLKEDGILFSQDAFGMHLATPNLFADENLPDVLKHESDKYYANIVTPYSKMVGSAMEKLLSLNLPISIVAPDHGPLWRRPEDIAKVIGWYKDYVAQPFTKKVVIAYDTMWGSTGQMASAFAEGVALGGCTPKVICLKGSHRSDVMKELISAGAFAIGSCTMNNGIYPTVADLLTYVRGLHPINLLGAVFGSYGWNTLAFKELNEYLVKTGIEVVTPDVQSKFVPDAGKLIEARNQGYKLSQALLEKIGAQA